MDSNLLIQFIVVGVILAGTIGWIIYHTFFKKKSNSGSCCNCALSDNCSKLKSNKNTTHKSKNCK